MDCGAGEAAIVPGWEAVEPAGDKVGRPELVSCSPGNGVMERAVSRPTSPASSRPSLDYHSVGI